MPLKQPAAEAAENPDEPMRSPFLPPPELTTEQRVKWLDDQGEAVWKGMIKGVDYGPAAGFENAKDTIRKPGILKALQAVGALVLFPDIDITGPDAEGHYVVKVISVAEDEVTGQYRGEGFGAGSTRDPKYSRWEYVDGKRTNNRVFQDGGVSLNTEVKMTKKRSMADLAHNIVPGLNVRSTMDLDDMRDHIGSSQYGEGGGQSSRAPSKSRGGQSAATQKPAAAAGNVAQIEPPKVADEELRKRAILYRDGMQETADINDFAETCVTIVTDEDIKGSPPLRIWLNDWMTAIRKDRQYQGVKEIMDALRATAKDTPAAAPAPKPVAPKPAPAEEPAEEEVDKGASLEERATALAESTATIWMEWLDQDEAQRKEVLVPVPAETDGVDAWMQYGATVLAHCQALRDMRTNADGDEQQLKDAEAARQAFVDINKPGLSAMVRIPHLTQEAGEVIQALTGVPQ